MCHLVYSLYVFRTPAPGHLHAVFAGFISKSESWRLLCKERVMAEIDVIITEEEEQQQQQQQQNNNNNSGGGNNNNNNSGSGGNNNNNSISTTQKFVRRVRPDMTNKVDWR